MKLLLIITSLLSFSLMSLAQDEYADIFKEEILNFKRNTTSSYNPPYYYLGHYSDGKKEHMLTLPDNMMIDTPMAYFYLVLTLNDTCTGNSGGGEDNALWTAEVIEKTVDDKTYLLVFALWKFRVKPQRLGQFKARLRCTGGSRFVSFNLFKR